MLTANNTCIVAAILFHGHFCIGIYYAYLPNTLYIYYICTHMQFYMSELFLIVQCTYTYSALLVGCQKKTDRVHLVVL